MRKRTLTIVLIGIPLVCLLCVLAYFLPPVNDRLAWRVDEVRTRIKYRDQSARRSSLHPWG